MSIQDLRDACYFWPSSLNKEVRTTWSTKTISCRKLKKVEKCCLLENWLHVAISVFDGKFRSVESLVSNAFFVERRNLCRTPKTISCRKLKRLKNAAYSKTDCMLLYQFLTASSDPLRDCLRMHCVLNGETFVSNQKICLVRSRKSWKMLPTRKLIAFCYTSFWR